MKMQWLFWLPLLIAPAPFADPADTTQTAHASQPQGAPDWDPIARSIESAKRSIRPVPLQGPTQGGIALWSERTKVYAVDGRMEIELAKKSDGTVDLAVVHSGYSEPDPDGRMALLTAGFAIRESPAGEELIASLLRSGVEFAVPDGARIRLLPELEFDIEIPESPTAAEKIRKSMRLPLKANAFGKTIPIQAKFEQLPAAELRAILVQEEGLRVLCRRHGTIIYSIGRDIQLNKAGVLAFLGTLAADDRYTIPRSDVARLADVLVKSELLEEIKNGETSLIERNTAGAYVELVINFLQKNSIQDNDTAIVVLADFERVDFVLARARQVELPFVVESRLAIGPAIKRFPDVIKDATTGKTGVDTIPDGESPPAGDNARD